MAIAQKITKEVVTGVRLDLTLDQASMLRSLLGQVVECTPLKDTFDALYRIIPERDYDVTIKGGGIVWTGINLRKVK